MNGHKHSQILRIWNLRHAYNKLNQTDPSPTHQTKPTPSASILVKFTTFSHPQPIKWRTTMCQSLSPFQRLLCHLIFPDLLYRVSPPSSLQFAFASRVPTWTLDTGLSVSKRHHTGRSSVVGRELKRDTIEHFICPIYNSWQTTKRGRIFFSFVALMMVSATIRTNRHGPVLSFSNFVASDSSCLRFALNWRFLLGVEGELEQRVELFQWLLLDICTERYIWLKLACEGGLTKLIVRWRQEKKRPKQVTSHFRQGR